LTRLLKAVSIIAKLDPSPNFIVRFLHSKSLVRFWRDLIIGPIMVTRVNGVCAESDWMSLRRERRGCESGRKMKSVKT
jgi:hypothetical protein